ncbi:MAG: hypothetical protein EBU96_01325 [Actinobacteria bacterium]|nr:hypothetical protein [Actinomycetota bacterium]
MRIRVSAVSTTIFAVAMSTVVMNVAAAGHSITASVRQSGLGIKATAFVVPMEYLEEQTVVMSDFRQFAFGKGIADPLDSVIPDDQVALSPGLTLTDSVTMYDVVYKDVTEVVDYDRNDADVDPDPVTASDTSNRDVGKTLTDSATASDSAPVFAQNKTTTDTVTASDTVNTKDVGKAVTDTATASDASPVFNASKVVADSASATDAAALNVDKSGITDTATAADSASLQPDIAKTDSVTTADTLNSFDIGKNPSDSVTASDTVNSFAVQTVLADSVTMTDVVYKDFTEMVDYDRNTATADPDPVSATDTTALAVTTTKSDSATASDSVALNPTTVQTDSVTGDDSVAFAPASVYTDSATASDSVALSSSKVTTDTATASDTTPVFLVSPAYSDSATASDAAPVFTVAQVLSDSATMAESISLNLILGQSSPLYDFAFTSDDKFTYFAVPGTINSHQVHQPLVNGEFVLAVDPNAGIVYTMRTESTEYTFNGYGINSNQLN